MNEGFEIKLNFVKIAETEIDLMNILLNSISFCWRTRERRVDGGGKGEAQIVAIYL